MWRKGTVQENTSTPTRPESRPGLGVLIENGKVMCLSQLLSEYWTDGRREIMQR